MSNKRLAINMLATFTTFAVGMGISFFLSPFIVRTLGRAAYGFVGLSYNITSYTSLLTVALNAMAGRFVAIAYMKGNKEEANEYFSSVFFSNIILAIVIAVISVVVVYFVNILFSVPDNLLFDVRALLSLMFLNTIVGLITSIFGVATFITNRLDLSSIRNIIGNVINAVCVVLLFCLFIPHVWYIGLAALICTMYTSSANWILKRRLTPDLNVSISLFRWEKVWELVKSGIWNVIGKFNNILSSGLDLLYANIFVGAASMGTLSISKAISSIALGLFGSISGIFSPELTSLYAQNKIGELAYELKKTIRILSCFSTPILCGLFVLSGDFFKLWMPTQDSNQLWLLSSLGISSYMITLPEEGLWNIFTITNKLKYSNLTLLAESLIDFSCVMLAMFLVKDSETKLVIIAAISSIWAFVRNATFLPMYGAHCLHQKLTTFYSPVLRSILSLAISLVICFVFRHFLVLNSWISLILAAIVIATIAFSINFVLVLTHSDKIFFKNCVVRAANKVTNTIR